MRVAVRLRMLLRCANCSSFACRRPAAIARHPRCAPTASIVQVSEKLDETRKYYATYNTLEKKRQFLSKEEGLIASMLENYQVAMKVRYSPSLHGIGMRRC